MEVTLQQAGRVHQVDHARKTWLQQVIADHDYDIDVIWSQADDRGDRYDPRRSGAAVSE